MVLNQKCEDGVIKKEGNEDITSIDAVGSKEQTDAQNSLEDVSFRI